MNYMPRRITRLALLALTVLAALLLTPRIAHAQSYWFENYESAVKMIDAGRMAEASELLARIVQEHPVPLANVRVPGDRFIEYLPYYQMARIQLHNGDTRAASRSLDICEAFGAIKQNRRSAKQLQELREQIALKAPARTTQAATVGATSP